MADTASAVEVNPEEQEALLERFARWEREGTLDNLELALKAVNALLDILTPELVEGMVQQVAGLLELVDRLAQSEVLPVQAMVEDVESLLRDPPVVQKRELRHLWHELNDPDAQAGLELVLGLLKLAGRRTALKQ